MKYISLAICICAFLAASIAHGYLMDALFVAALDFIIALFLGLVLATLAVRGD